MILKHKTEERTLRSLRSHLMSLNHKEYEGDGEQRVKERDLSAVIDRCVA